MSRKELAESAMLPSEKKNLMFKLQERSISELVDLKNQMKLTASAPIERKVVGTINEEDPKRAKSSENLKKDKVGNTEQIDNAVQQWMNGETTDISKKGILERSSSGMRRKGSEAQLTDRRFQWKSRTKSSDNVQAIDPRKRGNTVDPSMVIKPEIKNPQLNKLKNEKNESSSSKDKKRGERQTHIVSNYEDVPRKFRKEVESAKIPLETVDDNLFALLNILHFCEHNVVFVYKKGDVERKTRSQKKSIKFDIEKKEGTP